MAHLFIVENTVAKPTSEVLLIEPYKTIWSRDTTRDKSEAIKDFTYIEFMVSKKKTNPFAGYDDETRHIKLRELLFNSSWTPDKLIEAGMIKLHEFQTEASPTYSYYLAVLKGAEKMKEFFNTVDITERSERTGLPIYKPGDITRAMTDTDKVLQNLNTMRDRVEQELFEQVKTRGNKTINYFEQ